MKQWLNEVNWDKVCRTTAHALLMIGSIVMVQYPQYNIYAPVLVYIGTQIDSTSKEKGGVK